MQTSKCLELLSHACVVCSCFSGAVSQHNSQLHEGCARISLHGAVLFSAWPGCNGAYCSCQSSLPPALGCTYRYYIQYSYCPVNYRIVLHQIIVCVSTSVSFCVSFRALHSNSIHGGSDDGGWHWWRRAGVLRHGPGNLTCQLSPTGHLKVLI